MTHPKIGTQITEVSIVKLIFSSIKLQIQKDVKYCNQNVICHNIYG